MKNVTSAVVLLGAIAIAPAAAAQEPNRWDGTWTGTTNKGSPVEIVIAGEKVTGFAVRGENLKVSLSTPSGRGMSIVVTKGGSPVTVRLIRQEGETASYRYADMAGVVEDATLTRK